jgi:hypothetical protein
MMSVAIDALNTALKYRAQVAKPFQGYDGASAGSYGRSVSSKLGQRLCPAWCADWCSTYAITSCSDRSPNEITPYSGCHSNRYPSATVALVLNRRLVVPFNR